MEKYSGICVKMNLVTPPARHHAHVTYSVIISKLTVLSRLPVPPS